MTITMKRLLLFTTSLLALCLSSTLPAFAKGKAEHVILMIWDGMRPDFVLPQYAPHLYSLATNGVFFKNHHSVYITSTEVNGTALATGVYPNRSGIMANSDYRPEIGWLSAFGTENLDAIRRADFLTRDKFILVPTVCEILQDAGFSTFVAGTKPVAVLHDRSGKKTTEAEKASVTLFKGMTIPRAAYEGLVKVNDDKQFPATTTYPNTAQDAWTTKALTHGLWKKSVSKYSVLWLSDADYSQHNEAPGHDSALAAVESADKQLGAVLKVLDEKKLRDKTDIIVASDHGFSTVERTVDVMDLLKKAKFNAFRKFENPEPGDVLVVALGASVSLYVVDSDEAVVRRLVEFFQMSNFAAAIFTRLQIDGTFPLSQVRIGTDKTGPDVLVALKWSMDKNAYGAPGMFISDTGTKGKGSHGSFGPSDVHNTCVMSGPDFKKGLINELPSCSVDLPPTILHVLGVKPPVPMDGRVLQEALVSGKGEVPTPEVKTIEATRELGLFRWKQYLKYTKVGDAIYYDEAGGGSELK
jgi:predicted AlkP superfamily pyrophosphatase or phosphodiesterase